MAFSPQQKEILQFAKDIFKPRPHLTGSEWADRYFMLSAESSSLSGKWKTRPYQKEIIDSMTDTISQFVVIKKPTRVGYNKMLNITIGYFIHQQPAVILFYAPNSDEAKGTAETELEPMIRDNPEILKLVEAKNIRGRTKKEKTIKKNYAGGYLEVLALNRIET
jgi:phage terminase large subunit GpA-like protein